MSRFVSTSGVLLETSCGAFTVDLYGADAPAHTAEFVNLCRCKAWNGAVVTAVIPEVAVIFSHTACADYLDALTSELNGSTVADETTMTMSGGSVFWSLVAGSVATAVPAGTQRQSTVLEEVRQQQQALSASVLCAEAQQCKRRSVSTLSRSGAVSHSSSSSSSTGAGALGRKGQLLVPLTTASSAASVSPTSGTARLSLLRFAITLGDRNMDFLDGEWLAIGQVTEGLAVGLPRLRAAVAATSVVATSTPAPLSPWPRPARLVRLKHSTVLPTAGTAPFWDRPMTATWASASTTTTAAATSTAAAVLKASGCFAHWASVDAVLCANQTLVRALQHCHCAAPSPEARPRCLVRLPAHHTSQKAALVSIEYEPHFTADFLSSDEELAADLDDQAHTDRTAAVWEPAARLGRDTGAVSSKTRDARRERARQAHQEKANETLSLMLNVLNGITDVSGEIRPPENVLFVCKLNPATTGDGLAMVFAQFGKVVSAEVIMDPSTKQSLGYGFVEFESVETCYRAFTRMDKALVDDCRIHVDFSQSVSKLWAQRQRQQRSRKREREDGSVSH